ncbi:MAG: hemerythrin family protein [Lachnospiraceae bacterium]|nr:hemerythrin family protein [Lachnospiraceae bacterium]
MEKVVWDEKFKIGVEVVDKAHAKLFRIIGKLQELALDAGTHQHTYKEAIKYLEDYSMKHFSEEEAYMRSIRYSEYAWHKKIHDNFRDKTLVSLKRDLVLSDYSTSAVQRFVSIMNGWLCEHIMKEDQAIVGKAIIRKGNGVSSQASVISRTVNRTMQDMFQLDAKLVNTDYKGQNIGNGFYCRQKYDVEGGLRVQLLLGVEEPLLRRAISLMTGVEEEKATNEAAFPVFEQLFQQVGRLFQIETEYQLERENMLDRDGFRKEFMKVYPCSLLFSTKVGYFVFCYRSWRIKNQKSQGNVGKDKDGAEE